MNVFMALFWFSTTFASDNDNSTRLPSDFLTQIYLFVSYNRRELSLRSVCRAWNNVFETLNNAKHVADDVSKLKQMLGGVLDPRADFDLSLQIMADVHGKLRLNKQYLAEMPCIIREWLAVAVAQDLEIEESVVQVIKIGLVLSSFDLTQELRALEGIDNTTRLLIRVSRDLSKMFICNNEVEHHDTEADFDTMILLYEHLWKQLNLPPLNSVFKHYNENRTRTDLVHLERDLMRNGLVIIHNRFRQLRLMNCSNVHMAEYVQAYDVVQDLFSLPEILRFDLAWTIKVLQHVEPSEFERFMTATYSEINIEIHARVRWIQNTALPMMERLMCTLYAQEEEEMHGFVQLLYALKRVNGWRHWCWPIREISANVLHVLSLVLTERDATSDTSNEVRSDIIVRAITNPHSAHPIHLLSDDDLFHPSLISEVDTLMRILSFDTESREQRVRQVLVVLSQRRNHGRCMTQF